MRLTFVSIFASSSDAASVDQAKVTDLAQMDAVAPAGIRSLRGYKVEDEERGVATSVSTSIDDVLSKLNNQKSSLLELISKKKLNTMLTEEFVKTLRSNKSYMDKVFTKAKLNKMLTNEKYAEKKYVEWYALGLTDKTITTRLTGVGEHFGTLHTQYAAFINRMHGVA
ncbi:hypothetical protein V7S43_006511 [Phytophthora oleae]|uniref:RxLR effector protein n=1 Tax=Phytophthora oleae TaxID=2107226 RepID=A0ABD3FNS9_9STRA